MKDLACTTVVGPGLTRHVIVHPQDSPEMFDDFDWDPIPNFYDQVNYDAMISLGIGLCNMTEEFPSGLEIVDAVKATSS